jgi:hypothetical protein
MGHVPALDGDPDRDRRASCAASGRHDYGPRPQRPAPRTAPWRAAVKLLPPLTTVALAVGLTRVVGQAAALPAVTFDPYLRRADGAVADPVNLLFVGAGAEETAAAVARVLGWQSVRGSPMTFADGGAVYPTVAQLGLELGRSSRYHMRLAPAITRDGRVRVMAAVHRDDPAACGHVGRAFDEARDVVAAAFHAAGYRVAYLWAGNVAPGPHCDGSEPPADGHVAVIDLEARR